MEKATRLWALLIFGAFSFLQAHHFSVSLAEMELNSQERKLEVALKLNAYDLERALKAFYKRPRDLEKEEKNSLELFRYLEKRISFQTSAQKKLPLKWVGHELEKGTIWLYFVVVLPKQSLKEIQIQNQVLFELESEQIHLWNFTSAEKKKQTLCFLREKYSQKLALILPEKSKDKTGSKGKSS